MEIRIYDESGDKYYLISTTHLQDSLWLANEEGEGMGMTSNLYDILDKFFKENH